MDSRIDLTENQDFHAFSFRKKNDLPNRKNYNSLSKMIGKSFGMKTEFPWTKKEKSISADDPNPVLAMQAPKWEKNYIHGLTCERCSKEIKIPWKRVFMLCIDCENDMERDMGRRSIMGDLETSMPKHYEVHRVSAFSREEIYRHNKLVSELRDFWAMDAEEFFETYYPEGEINQ